MRSHLISFLCTAAFCATTVSSFGAPVLWNEEITLGPQILPEGDDRNIWWISISLLKRNEEVYMQLGIQIEENGTSGQRIMHGVDCDLGMPWWVVAAETGDEINDVTGKDASRLFFTNTTPSKYDMLKPEYLADTPWTLYLGLSLTHGGKWTEADGWITPEHTIYGWVELTVDNYTMTLGDTCLDLTGRPVVVGVRSAEPIPEPATGALAFAGAALLVRRRPRRSSPPESPPRCANTGFTLE